VTGATLEERWRLVTARVAPQASVVEVERVVTDLLDRHRQPHRRYHTVEHVAEVLDALDALGPPSDAVALAAWFHDCVYDPTARPGDNEGASAAVAVAELSRLAVDERLVGEVARLVRLTASHAVDPGDDDGELLVDADLAILAAPPERYRRYVEAVRAEYGHVDDVAWRVGRSAFVEGMLARPRLFNTETARQRLDATARVNLTEELATLRRSQPQA
jgi:predicted metal-dependent HD superfamily phosphohydrolase